MTDKFAAKMVYNIAINNKLNFTLEEIEALRMAVTALKLDDQIRWERDVAIQQLADLGYSLGEKPRTSCSENPNSSDCISRKAAVDALWKALYDYKDEAKRQFLESEELNLVDWTIYRIFIQNMIDIDRQTILNLPSIEQPEVICCKDCKHWRRQTNYQGAPLSFGFCESEDMWRSLYGETVEVSHIDTDDDFYCGYAERRTDA